ncbi:MAG: HoxN/HupN/NixA family nickel/cobalt transporter, partial [Solirubrobacterales bacterium]
AFTRPIRKLYYNLTITSISVLVALLVGGVEALGLLVNRLHLVGGLWDVVATLNADFGSFGYLIVAVFVVSWVISAAIYRLKGYDALDVARAAD